MYLFKQMAEQVMSNYVIKGMFCASISSSILTMVSVGDLWITGSVFGAVYVVFFMFSKYVIVKCF